MYQQLTVLVAIWEATYYMGFDCYGNDIGGSNVNSVDECQWLCQVSLYKPTCIILAMTEIVFASDATGVLCLRLRCSSFQHNVLHQERLPCAADAVDCWWRIWAPYFRIAYVLKWITTKSGVLPGKLFQEMTTSVLATPASTGVPVSTHSTCSRASARWGSSETFVNHDMKFNKRHIGAPVRLYKLYMYMCTCTLQYTSIIWKVF